jgi:hypothetical protein
MNQEDKAQWYEWAEWDKQRYLNQLAVYTNAQKGKVNAATRLLESDTETQKVKEKKRPLDDTTESVAIPKKKNKKPM